MKYKYSKEQIVEAVKKSLTIKECLINLRMVPKGSNYGSLNKWIKMYEINTDHFDIERIRLRGIQNYIKKQKIPIEDILVTNSTYSRTDLKKRLYSLEIKERICEICGQGEEWMGRKMSLILDHINGIYNDNRIINLRIVCPNCNATLDTHGSKNIKLQKERNNMVVIA